MCLKSIYPVIFFLYRNLFPDDPNQYPFHKTIPALANCDVTVVTCFW
jgi:hypothetical protein